MAHPVVHFEIGGRDAKRTQQFYASLFDWEIDTQSMGDGYGGVCAVDGGIGGGLLASPTGEPFVTIYVRVDDLAAHLAKAERLGGRALVQPTEIPGGGAWAMFQDPDGNAVGLYRA